MRKTSRAPRAATCLRACDNAENVTKIKSLDKSFCDITTEGIIYRYIPLDDAGRHDATKKCGIALSWSRGVPNTAAKTTTAHGKMSL